MQNIVKPSKKSSSSKSSGSKGHSHNPKKPGSDPDQTPAREVKHVPTAKPGKK